MITKLSLLIIKMLVLPVLNEKLAALNPGIEKVVQFCLTFPSGLVFIQSAFRQSPFRQSPFRQYSVI